MTVQWPELARASLGGLRPPRIAVFEPEPVTVLAIRKALAGFDFHYLPVGDPALSVRDWLNLEYDLVIVNAFASVGRPEEVCMLCRRLAVGRPVFALTAQNCATQRTLTIASGADDAMDITAAPNELATRIAALLRRHRMTQGTLSCDELEIDLIRRAVSRAGRSIIMPTREFDLLATLAQTPDQIVPRTDLLRSVWRLDFDPGTNRIEVHMSRLRSRIDRGERFAMLRTVKGIGYALVSRSGDDHHIRRASAAAAA